MYGICHLSIIPVRKNSTSKSELVSQLIYGELFKVIEKKEKWFYIESIDDKYSGWINHSQFKEILEQDFKKVKKIKSKLLNNISSEIETENGNMSITIGSKISSAFILNHKLKQKEYSKSSIIKNSLKFLNSPYLWGGRTPYGIDCSGFSQQVYKLNGFQLARDASQQALQGKEVKLEKAKPGDLAFFGDKKITHVGIIMDSNKIIHSFGCVRIDYLNEKGIINSISKKTTHYLKKIVTY
ncbi:C40 family peptidase [Flavobacteriaceae bacterium]|nr:C40 family peptidase [Flavobacteriaceae bacterium]